MPLKLLFYGYQKPGAIVYIPEIQEIGLSLDPALLFVWFPQAVAGYAVLRFISQGQTIFQNGGKLFLRILYTKRCENLPPEKLRTSITLPEES